MASADAIKVSRCEATTHGMPLVTLETCGTAALGAYARSIARSAAYRQIVEGLDLNPLLDSTSWPASAPRPPSTAGAR